MDSNLLLPTRPDETAAPAERLGDPDALACVHAELERVLEGVPRALRRLRRAAPVAGDDVATVLQASARQLHQAAGALRMVGFDGVARLPQAAAQALLKPGTPPEGAPAPAVTEAVERGCTLLQAWLRRWRAGQAPSPLVLFPAWNALAALAGTERIHPADLWPVPWSWQPLPVDARLPPLQPDASTLGAAEQLTLALMRNPRGPAAERLGNLFAALARGAADGRMATLWGLAAAVFEGQARGLIAPDVHLKRKAARLLTQMRRGPLATADAAAQRLAHDLLFFCAQAGEAAQGGSAPRLAAVRSAWGLQRHPAIDLERGLPDVPDTTLQAQTLKRLTAAQALWDAAAAGTPRPGLAEGFQQLAQALRQLLPQQEGAVEALGQALQQAAAAGTPAPALALELAQALLALQLLLQEQAFDSLGPRLEQLAQRIARAQGAGPQAAAAAASPVEPWLEALAHEVDERQAMQALGQAVRTSLREAAEQLDMLAQAPDARGLQTLLRELQRLQSVLSVLSQPELSQALKQVRRELSAGGTLDAARAQRLAQRLAELDLACERMTLGLPAQLPPPAAFEPLPARAEAPQPAGHPEVPAAAAAAGPQVDEVSAPAEDEPEAMPSGWSPSTLPELADVAVPLLLTQPVVEERIELATLLRHRDPTAPAVAGAAKPPVAPAVPTRTLAAARLIGGAASHRLDGEPEAAEAAPVAQEGGADAATALPPAAAAQAGPDAQADAAPAAAAQAAPAGEALALPTVPAADAPAPASVAAAAAKAAPAVEDESLFDLSLDLPPAAVPLPPLEEEEASFDLSFDLPGPEEAPAAPAQPAAGAPGAPGATPEEEAAWWLAPQPDAAAAQEPADFELHFDAEEAPAAAEADAPAPPPAEPAPPPVPPAWATVLPIVVAAPIAPAVPGVDVFDPYTAPEDRKEVRLVGPLRVPRPLFDIYAEEADALSSRLIEKLAQWQPPQALERELVVVTQALSGMADTVGDQALAQLARVLEDVMTPCRRDGYGTPAMAAVAGEGVQRLRLMLGQFLGGVLPAPVEPEFLRRLRAPHAEALESPFGPPPAVAQNPFAPPPTATVLRADAVGDAESLDALSLYADPLDPSAPAEPDAGLAAEAGDGLDGWSLPDEMPAAPVPRPVAEPGMLGWHEAAPDLAAEPAPQPAVEPQAAAPAEADLGTLSLADEALDLAAEPGPQPVVEPETPALTEADLAALSLADEVPDLAAEPAPQPAAESETPAVTEADLAALSLADEPVDLVPEPAPQPAAEPPAVAPAEADFDALSLADGPVDLAAEPTPQPAVEPQAPALTEADLAALSLADEPVDLAAEPAPQPVAEPEAPTPAEADFDTLSLADEAPNLAAEPAPRPAVEPQAPALTEADLAALSLADEASDLAAEPVPQPAAEPQAPALTEADLAALSLADEASDLAAEPVPQPAAEPEVPALTKADLAALSLADEAPGLAAEPAPQPAAELETPALTEADLAALSLADEPVDLAAEPVSQPAAEPEVPALTEADLAALSLADEPLDLAAVPAPQPVAEQGVPALTGADLATLSPADAGLDTPSPAGEPVELAAAPAPAPAAEPEVLAPAGAELGAPQGLAAEPAPQPPAEPEVPPLVQAALDALSLENEPTTPPVPQPAAEPEVPPLVQAALDALSLEDEPPAPQPEALESLLDDPQGLDASLFPIFEEEAQELLPELAHGLRAWAEDGDDVHAAACMRTLHTLKGGARLSGAMRLGDAAHRLESAIEALLARSAVPMRSEIEALLERADALSAAFEWLRLPTMAAEPVPVEEGAPEAAAAGSPVPAADADADGAPSAAAHPGTAPEAAGASEAAALPIDWSRFAVEPPPLPPAAAAASPAATVRVRAPALDRLVAQAGEVGISRARLSAEVQQLGASLADLEDNLQRLRSQLREVELQAETPLDARAPAAQPAAPAFDALEMERYTRLQELARVMAESLDDVATVQHSLREGLRNAEDELAAQGRLARELQDELLRTRLVAFDSLAERLQRLLRQTAQEAQRQVRLEIEGGAVEIDCGVLERMTPAFEHLLRNAVVHGIEPPAERFMAGKPAEGHVLLRLVQEGSHVLVSCGDDGRGLDLPRIRRRAVERGLLALEAQPEAAALQRLVFAPGFSTAERLSPLAGRGVGLDVVRAEVEALGGRIDVDTTPGQGSRFTLQLPLSTAVMQVLMLRCGEATVAVPAALVEEVQRLPAEEAARAAAAGTLGSGAGAAAFFTLEALLQQPPAPAPGRMATVLVLRGAQQRLLVQVREVLGRQEAVLKPLGPQLASLPGLSGMTLLPSGTPVPVYNPAALALRLTAAQQAAQVAPHGLWPRAVWGVAAAGDAGPQAAGTPAAAPAPLVLVVDDSLTVRRFTQRLLEREGYRVALAKDGLQAMEQLAQEVPAVVLTDLEMPRLDGFDLLRSLRSEPRWRELPVIVITSRIAARHRELAASLGVAHYLGKPYGPEELLSLVARYSGRLQTH